jgi:hypothetical protein
VRRVGGLTLCDKLRTDKVAARTSGAAMGGPYYSHLKTLYSTDSQIAEALTPKKKDEPINDQLMRSMVAAKRAVADRSEMQKYMATATEVTNPRETCGLFKFLIGLRTGRRQQLSVALDMLRCCARFDLAKKFKV